MTCVVGIADGKSVWMGADSAGVSGWDLTIRADRKVFNNGPVLFGFTTSFRMGQLLQHSLTVPKHHEGSDERWLCTTFIDAVRTCLSDGGWSQTDKGRDEGGNFLVGYNGRLYEVASDFQVGDPVDQVAAVGCAWQYALGAMHVTDGKARDRIVSALNVAERFSAGVCGPFSVIEGGRLR